MEKEEMSIDEIFVLLALVDEIVSLGMIYLMGSESR